MAQNKHSLLKALWILICLLAIIDNIIRICQQIQEIRALRQN